MKHRYTFLLCCFLSGLGLTAQSFCSPTFVNGCTLWHNQTIAIGTINWSIGATACTVSDYTAQSTTVTAGVASPMTVTSGVWCGCAVWVDLDNDQTFQDSENLYYSYVGGDPGYTYSFNITIPPGTPSGPHRMRVISPWGSDGFLSTNVNGFGPCGAYQYGNFDDFTLNVSGTTGITSGNEANPSRISAAPNPTTSMVMLDGLGPDRLTQVNAYSMDGRWCRTLSFAPASGRVQLDLSELDAGMYVLTCAVGDAVKAIKVIKE